MPYMFPGALGDAPYAAETLALDSGLDVAVVEGLGFADAASAPSVAVFVAELLALAATSVATTPFEYIVETVGLSAPVTVNGVQNSAVVDGWEFGDTSSAGFSKEVLESLGLTDSVATPLLSRLVESLALADDAQGARGFYDTLVELLGVNDTGSAVKGFFAVVAEELGVTPSLIATDAVRIFEHLGFVDTRTANMIRRLLLVEDLGLESAIAMAVPLVVAEGIGLAEAVAAGRGVAIAEELGLLEVCAPSATYGLAIRERLALAAELAKFLGADVAEALGIAATQSVVGRGYSTIVEGLGLETAVAPLLLANVVLSEGLELSDTEIVNAVYTQTVVEGLELRLGYSAPGGGFTTWVVNTRTGAASEYDNYEFNSFARFGNKYIGASSTGLYELLGDDDDGDPIVSVLAGGYIQFGGTKLSRLKAAYIGMRGAEDDMVLKIETMDGETYVYTTPTRSGRSTKVHMGKGQRSRYFAWTLTTVGQDFDLDTIEFVPVALDRRV